MKRYSLMLLMLMLACVDLSAQDFMWAKQIASTSTNPNYGPTAVWMEQDAAGNIYIAGTFGGTVDFDPGTGNFNLTAGPANDYYVLKLNSNGDFIWAVAFTDASGEISPYDIAIDDIGNVYVSGFFYTGADLDPGAGTSILTSVGNSDGFVLKLDSAGNFLWAKQVGENARSIVIDSEGKVCVTGSFTDTRDFDPGPGTFNLTSAGNTDFFCLQLDAAGNFIWAYSEGGSSSDIAWRITTDGADNIYIAFITSNQLSISKLNQQGSHLWTKNAVSGHVNYANITVNGSEIILTGVFENTSDFDPGAGVYNLTALNVSDMFIQKLDTSAGFIWAGQLSCTGYAAANPALIDDQGDVYISGRFHETCDFDPGLQQYSLTAIPNLPDYWSDLFLLKLTDAGSFVTVKQIGNSGQDIGGKIMFDDTQNILLCAWFKDTLDVDPNADVHELVTPGSRSAYVLKLSSSLNVPNMSGNKLVANIYPNPTTGRVTITSGQPMEKILVTDVLGRIMQQVTASGISVSLNLDVQPGLYYVTVITNEGRSSTQKLVINNK